MATYRVCSKHGVYLVQTGVTSCPECDDKKANKKSKKYGGQSIIIPPHMKARTK